MLNPKYAKQFEKDLKNTVKSDKDTKLLKDIISKLINQEQLDKKYRDHKLLGNYKDRRECHVKPDLLLIYKLTKPDIIFERIGSHSELFK